MSDDKFLASLLSATSPSKETNSCDKNGNFDVSKEEYVIDKEARRLSASSVESFTENPIKEACKIHTEREMNSIKEAVVNEVNILCDSVVGILEADNSSKVRKTIFFNIFFYLNYTLQFKLKYL